MQKVTLCRVAVGLMLVTATCAILSAPSAHAATAATYVGGAICDGNDALESALYTPSRVAIGPDQNLYITDTENHRIRKVDLVTNIISTFAGNGIPAYGGDGGPALEASMEHPIDLEFDAAGNLYIVDSYNYRVRMVDTNGIMHTVAGNGFDTGPGGPDDIGDGGPATNAYLHTPRGFAVFPGGQMLIADTGHNRIRFVDAYGTISTFAGIGSAGYSGDGGQAIDAEFRLPRDVAYGKKGVIFVADVFNNVIRKIDRDGIITTYAGNNTEGFSGDGGPATEAALWRARGLFIHEDGLLYIADTQNGAVRKVDENGIITTVAGLGYRGFSGDDGPAVDAELNYVYGITFDGDGKLFIADMGNSLIRMVDTEGIIHTAAGGGCFVDNVPATDGALNDPTYVAVDQNQNLFVADTLNYRIRRVDGQTGIMTTVAGTGEIGFSGDGGPAIDAVMNLPSGLAVDEVGNVYISDTLNSRVRRIDGAGFITTIAGDGVEGFGGDGGPATAAQLDFPVGLEYRPATNTLLIADAANNRIRQLALNTGIITTIIGSGLPGYNGDGIPATDAALNFPRDVTGDSNGNIFIADTSNNRIRQIDSNGFITTIAGTGIAGYTGEGLPAIEANVELPAGIMVHNNEVYFSGTPNKVVRKITQQGIINLVAGIPNPIQNGFNGDGLDAKNTIFDYPVGLAFVGSRLMVGTSYANRVRMVIFDKRGPRGNPRTSGFLSDDPRMNPE